MYDEDEYDELSDGSSKTEELEQRVEELEQRISELEENRTKSEESRQSWNYDATYLLGTIIAIVLSWTRNASILWCIVHGILSWIYIIYFAFTR